MKSPLADRLLLVFVLECSALLVVVSLAESALGAFVTPVEAAALLIAACILVPVVVLMPAFAARADRLTRSIGWAVFALGTAALLVRSHEIPEITLLMVGIALLTYAEHRGRQPARSPREIEMAEDRRETARAARAA